MNRMVYNFRNFGNWVLKTIDRVREVGPQARLQNNSTEMAHKRSPHSSASYGNWEASGLTSAPGLHCFNHDLWMRKPLAELLTLEEFCVSLFSCSRLMLCVPSSLNPA